MADNKKKNISYKSFFANLLNNKGVAEFRKRSSDFFKKASKRVSLFVKKFGERSKLFLRKIYKNITNRDFWCNIKDKIISLLKHAGRFFTKQINVVKTNMNIWNDRRKQTAKERSDERIARRRREYEDKKKLIEDQKLVDEAMQKVDKVYKRSDVAENIEETHEKKLSAKIVAALMVGVSAVSLFFKKNFAKIKGVFSKKNDTTVERTGEILKQPEATDEIERTDSINSDAIFENDIWTNKPGEPNDSDLTVVSTKRTGSFMCVEDSGEETSVVKKHADEKTLYEDDPFFAVTLDNRHLKKRASNKHNIAKDKVGKEDEEKYSVWVRDRRPFFLVSIGVSVFKAVLLLVVLAGFAGIGVAFGVLRAYVASAPELSVEKIENNAQTSFIYDSQGELLYEYYNLENRSWASADEIPTLLKYAVVASEDESFFEHDGFNFKRIVASLIGNLTGSSYAGGSTITQQVLKLTLLTTQQTYKRKMQEIYLAYQLEQQYTKEEILEWYMNIMPMGGLLYGVKSAAEDYFGKELSELTLRECAVLAGMTQAPTMYNPRASMKSIEDGGYGEVGRKRLYARANYVLTQMYAVGFIDENEYIEALFDTEDMESEQLVVAPYSPNYTYEHKYYVEYVLDELVKRIMEANNWEGETGKEQARSVIRSGGLKIYTALNQETQTAVENAVYSFKEWPPLANPSQSVSVGGVEQPQCATIVIDNSTGYLAAIVGGKTEPTARLMLNRAYQSVLPIGSSIKPISVYAPALDQGVLGNMIIENIPAPIDGWVSELGYPVNSDGEQSYHGPTSISFALAKSMNIPTARILIERLGVNRSIAYLKALGFSESVLEFSPSVLALGSTGGYLIDSVAAFATLANEGVYREPLSILKILDKSGNEIFSYEMQEHRKVFKKSTVYIITQWLHRAASKPESALQIDLSVNPGIEVAGKTGTNEKRRGIGYIGYTKYYTCGVWLGHDDFNPEFAVGVSAMFHATPFWQAIMNSIHKNLESTKIYDDIPDDVVQVTICPISGKLPNGDLCSHDTYVSDETSDRYYKHELKTEYFIKGTEPTEICDMHVAVKYCKKTGMIATEYCGDDCEDGIAVILPEKSEYLKLIGGKYEYRLHMYFPTYFVNDVPYRAKMVEENVKDKDGKDTGKTEWVYGGQLVGTDCYCKYHTKETQDLIHKKELLTEETEVLIKEINKKLKEEKYSENIGLLQIEQLNTAIEYLNSCLNKPVYGDDKDLVFDLSEAQKAYDALKSLSETIFKRVDEVLKQKGMYEITVNDLIKSINTKLNNIDYAVVITGKELIDLTDRIKELRNAFDAPAYPILDKEDPSIVLVECFDAEVLVAEYDSLKKHSKELFEILDRRIAEQVVERDPNAKSPYADADTTEIINALNSKNALMIDAKTGRIVAYKNDLQRIYPASLTKIMSILVAYEYMVDNNININNTYVTITADIVERVEAEDAASAGFVEGERVCIRDLFYGAIVSSGADAIWALAEYCADNETMFVSLMNKRAASLGLRNTHFVTSTGLHDPNHYSTLRDVAVIFARALEYDFLRTVVETQSYTYPKTNKQIMRMVRSSLTNRRTDYNSDLTASEIEGAIKFGGVVGYTKEANYCLATYITAENGDIYITVTANCELSASSVADYVMMYRDYLREEDPVDPPVTPVDPPVDPVDPPVDPVDQPEDPNVPPENADNTVNQENAGNTHSN